MVYDNDKLLWLVSARKQQTVEIYSPETEHLQSLIVTFTNYVEPMHLKFINATYNPNEMMSRNICSIYEIMYSFIIRGKVGQNQVAWYLN